ncbi:hypothetical protein E4U42_001370 [Claviceps africana]|uniref:Cerato-platanin n=1 Tax=Claviceps africana TaxID=83212 RepID=A0A8K0NF85_9HYPO|nr:hypothetical protein E4U42_001370 [Claviceps africana]
MRILPWAAATLPLSSHASGSLVERGQQGDGAATIWATPHDSYSSSVGVLGCKIDTNRVAYWPQPVDCDGICVQVEYQDRRVHLLRIDQSTGAHDMSYDAWNYLYTGYSATERPTAGGAVEMKYRNVDASECRALLRTDGHKLPLSAANSMNFVAACLQRPDSWVANNYVALNIADAVCTLGVDEQCRLDWPGSNQPTCPHVLGRLVALKDRHVYNIEYPTGKSVLAGSGASSSRAGGDDKGASPRLSPPARPVLAVLAFVSLHIVS